MAHEEIDWDESWSLHGPDRQEEQDGAAGHIAGEIPAGELQIDSDIARLLLPEEPLDKRTARRLAVETLVAYEHVRDSLKNDTAAGAINAIRILGYVSGLADSHIEEEDGPEIRQAAKDSREESK